MIDKTIVLVTILATGHSDLLHPFWRNPAQNNFNNLNAQWSPTPWAAPVNCDFMHTDLTNAPVCGTDGKTYLNQDAIRQINCRNGNQVIAIKHTGICVKDCGVVDLIYSPVCGSDNITYINPEAIKQINCKNDLYGSEEITVKHPGLCTKLAIQDQDQNVNHDVNKVQDHVEDKPMDNVPEKDLEKPKDQVTKTLKQDLAADQNQDSAQQNFSFISGDMRRRMN